MTQLNFYHRQKNLERHDPDYRREEYLNIFSMLWLILLSTFTLINIFVTHIYSAALIELVGILFLFFMRYYYNKTQNLHRANLMFTWLTFLLILLFAVVSHKENYSLIWMFLFPVTAFFLLGVKQGTFPTLLFLALLFSYVFSLVPQTLSIIATVNISIAFSIFTAMIYYYEFSREEAFSQLHKVLDREHALSITDSVTQLYNRAQIDNELIHLILDYKHHQKSFSVIMVDIDLFKQVNDTYGHLVGDTVLKEFALLIKNFIRTTDTLGRWGGEEFMILLPRTDIVAAEKFAKSLCQTVRHHSFKKVSHLTASFGVTTIKTTDTVESLIKRADDALYQAKSEGRNQVISH